MTVLAGMVLAPLAELDHIGAGRWRLDLERVGRQFDLRAMGTELRDRPRMASFAGHGELEIVDARQSPPTVGVFHEADTLERHRAVEQFNIKFGAVLLDPLQRPLSQAVVMPHPRRGGRQQHHYKDVSQGQHAMNSNKVRAA